MLLSIKVAHQGRFRRISLNRDELERTDALQRLKEALGLPISAQLQFRDLNAPKSLRVSDGKDLKEAAKCSLDGGSTVLRLEVPVSIEERSKILEDSFVYIPSPTRPSKARQASPPTGDMQQEGRASPVEKLNAWKSLVLKKCTGNSAKLLQLDPVELYKVYSNLVNASCPDLEQISRDVSRTFPQNPKFRTTEGQEQLSRVLCAAALTLKGIGYVQGMNFIAGLLLMHTTEENAFALLCALLREPSYGLMGMFSQDMQQLHCAVYIVDRIIRERRTVLWDHLESEKISPIYFLPSWILPLFSTKLGVDDATNFLEVFMSEGFPALIRMPVKVLKVVEERLLACDSGQILMELNTSIWASATVVGQILRSDEPLVTDDEIFDMEMDYVTSKSLEDATQQDSENSTGISWSDLTSSWTLIEKEPMAAGFVAMLAVGAAFALGRRRR